MSDNGRDKSFANFDSTTLVPSRDRVKNPKWRPGRSFRPTAEMRPSGWGAIQSQFPPLRKDRQISVGGMPASAGTVYKAACPAPALVRKRICEPSVDHIG